MSVLAVQEQVGDPQRAQPLAGVVGENNLVVGDGPAEVDGGVAVTVTVPARATARCRRAPASLHLLRSQGASPGRS